MSSLNQLTSEAISHKTVLVRVDFNVPLTEANGQVSVSDDQRLQAALETINFLRQNQAKIILISHLGRPDGQVVPALSLKPIADYLVAKWQLPVKFCPEIVGPTVTTAVNKLQSGEILLLENARFLPGEEKNDPELAKQLASLAQIFVNEAFSAAHRAHASTAGVTAYLPSLAGFSLVKEVENLTSLLNQPARPFVVIVGGAKISDKVAAVKNLSQIADVVLTGGGVANNFLKAGGIETHHSFLETVDAEHQDLDYVAVAREILAAVQTEKMLKDGYLPLPKIITPIDVIAAADKNQTQTQVVDLSHGMSDTDQDQNLQYLDIGPQTRRLYTELIAQAKTVFWNGPVGVFEKAPFSAGTQSIIEALVANRDRQQGTTIIGGGETIAAAQKWASPAQFSYVSTAGGAALEFLGGKKLPGVEAVKNKEN